VNTPSGIAVTSLKRSLTGLAVCGGIVGVLVGTALAQDQPQGPKFLGHDITKIEGVYLVTKDVNVRAGPKTKSKKVGSFKSGSKVDVIGKAKGGAGWMAVQRDGKDFGFVYAPVLLPLIDGTLKKDINGRVMMRGRSPCAYAIRFRGRNVLEDEFVSFSDYEIEYRCTDSGKSYRFYAPMFIAEVPYRQTNNPVFQINIDLLGMDDDPDTIFSMTFLYRRDDNLVVFDSFSKADIGQKPEKTERPAHSVSEALAGAAETAPLTWTKETWKALVKLHKGSGE